MWLVDNESQILCKGDKSSLKMFFLPTRLGSHWATLHLKDPEVGELKFEIAAYSSEPHVSSIINWNLDTRALSKQTLLLPLVNHSRIQAMKQLVAVGLTKTESEFCPGPFAIKYSEPGVLAGPAEILLNEGDVAEVLIDQFSLPVEFHPPAPGNFVSNILMEAEDDIRVVQINADVRYAGEDILLNFHASINEQVSQQIPLSNDSNEPVLFVANVIENSDGPFSYERKIVVHPGTTRDLTLTFQPTYPGNVSRSLELINTSKGTKDRFLLKAEGHPPEPSDEFVANC
eukprot:UC4_evm2s1030